MAKQPAQNATPEKERLHPFMLASFILAIVVSVFYFLPRDPAPTDLRHSWQPDLGARAGEQYVQTPSESEMLQAIAGTVLELSEDTLVVRTEWPSPQGVRIIDRTLKLSPSAIVTIHEEAKSPEVFEAERAEYDMQVKAGATGLAVPFPNKTRIGSIRDLKLGMHITVRPLNPGVEPLVAAEIQVPLPPLPPEAPMPVALQ